MPRLIYRSPPKTDTEIMQLAESEVEQRIKRHTSATGRTKALVSLGGILIYDIEASRERQIIRGWTYYAELRASQLKIMHDFDELRRMQPKNRSIP